MTLTANGENGKVTADAIIVVVELSRRIALDKHYIQQIDLCKFEVTNGDLYRNFITIPPMIPEERAIESRRHCCEIPGLKLRSWRSPNA